MRLRKGRGSPPIPRPSPFTAPGLRPDRISRSGRGRRPPRRRLPAFGAGCLLPAPGADGTTVRASQPPDLARRGQGADGGGTPPKRRAGRPARGPRRTDRIQRGPRRSRALSGPPWSASGGWGSGRDSPPFCKALERVRCARVARGRPEDPGPEACRVGDPLGGVVMTSDRHHGEHRQGLTLTRRCRATPPFGRRGGCQAGRPAATRPRSSPSPLDVANVRGPRRLSRRGERRPAAPRSSTLRPLHTVT